MAEDWRVITSSYRIYWVLPPADQLRIAGWAEAQELVASLIDTALNYGRDACYVVEGDPDESAQYEGSVVERHAGFIQMYGGRATPGTIAIKPPGGQRVDDWHGVGLYACVQSEVIGTKRPAQLPGADPDHPEWGPAAGNALFAPSQLALSINGGALSAAFVIGYTMLFVLSGTGALAIGTAAAKLAAFDAAGQAAGVIPDTANDRITVQNAGMFSVTAALSVTGTPGRVATVRLRKNGVIVDGLRGDAELATAPRALALCGQVGCASGDVLELYAEADSDGTSLTVVSGSFAVTRI